MKSLKEIYSNRKEYREKKKRYYSSINSDDTLDSISTKTYMKIIVPAMLSAVALTVAILILNVNIVFGKPISRFIFDKKYNFDIYVENSIVPEDTFRRVVESEEMKDILFDVYYQSFCVLTDKISLSDDELLDVKNSDVYNVYKGVLDDISVDINNEQIEALYAEICDMFNSVMYFIPEDNLTLEEYKKRVFYNISLNEYSDAYHVYSESDYNLLLLFFDIMRIITSMGFSFLLLLFSVILAIICIFIDRGVKKSTYALLNIYNHIYRIIGVASFGIIALIFMKNHVINYTESILFLLMIESVIIFIFTYFAKKSYKKIGLSKEKM